MPKTWPNLLPTADFADEEAVRVVEGLARIRRRVKTRRIITILKAAADESTAASRSPRGRS